MKCPLCSHPAAPFVLARNRRYNRCARCELVFMEAGDRLTAHEEKAHYDCHRNNPNDPGYRRFVSPLFEAVRPYLGAGAKGLDFGCGAGSALMALFEEAGFEITGYDPFYADYPDRLARTYDFAVCSETAEHFFGPGKSFEQLFALLRPGGILGVMTGFYGAEQPFGEWHYIRDPSHVAFYSPQTFRFLGRQHRSALLLCHNNLAIFQKGVHDG